MKITLDLPEELIREVKLRAVAQRCNVNDLIAGCLRQGLGFTPPAQPDLPPADSMVRIGPNRLPVIRCMPNPPARRMSVTQLLQLQQNVQVD